MKLCLLIFTVLLGACVLDVTPDDYILPPLQPRDAGSEDSGQ